jgi:hypothetical protein
LCAFANGLELHALAQSADADCGANAGARRHLGERFVDLDGKFTRRAQDDGADARLFLCRNVIDDRQDERERLAGPGLRRCDNVAAGERRFDGQALDGRGLFKSVLR